MSEHVVDLLAGPERPDRGAVVVDLVDLVCEACDQPFEAARPDEDEPFIICGPCAIPA